MPDVDAFETAYGRLAFPRLAGAMPPARPADPLTASGPRPDEAGTPRSRLLPRLALLPPARPARSGRLPRSA